MSKIDELNPIVQNLAKQHIEKCKETGIDLSIYCTYRSFKEQDDLYAKGRTVPGKIVTNAKGGQSYHNFRVAYDCGPSVNRQIAWDRTDLFKKIGEIGESIGLEWGGRFKSIKDLPHFQYTRGHSTTDFLAGVDIANSETTNSSRKGFEFSNFSVSVLHPKVQELARKHIKNCKENGVDLTIYNTLSGQGYHKYGLAYDCGPVLKGRLVLNRPDLFKKVIGPCGQSFGLEWGGNFSKPEWPHFEYTGGRSLLELATGMTLDNPLNSLPRRASGGSVNSNSPYIVGEEGPELFVPNTNGTIINNTILKALLNNSINSGAGNILNNTAIQTELGSSQSEANLKSPLTILTETLVKLNSTINKYTSHFTSEMSQTDTGTNVKSSRANLSVEAEANQESSSETSEIGQGETQTGSWENLLGKWNENLQKSISQMTNWSTNMKSVASTAVQSLQSTMNTVFSDAVQGNLKSFKDYFKSFANSILQYLSSMLVNKIMGKAEGGPVAGGTTYLVGEQGPELFVPNTSGTIVPNNQLGGGLTIKSINVVNNTGVQTTATTSTQIDTDGYVVNVILNALATNKGGLRDALAR